MEWETIDSAPRDGSRVLLWEKYSDAPVVGTYWRGNWIACTEHYDTNGNAVVVDRLTQALISHWMPLPAPPKD